MKLSNEISNAGSLETIVNMINEAGNTPVSEEEIGPFAFAFSKAQLAGQYAAEAAWEGADDRDDIDSDSIEAHLDVLADNGAEFPQQEAIQRGMEVIEYFFSQREKEMMG